MLRICIFLCIETLSKLDFDRKSRISAIFVLVCAKTLCFYNSILSFKLIVFNAGNYIPLPEYLQTV